MKSTDFKDLVVWQKAMEIARDIYVLVRELPKEETYGLSDQMRRCAISIPSNIAEGQQRNSAKDFQHFINIAQGSRGELETQLLLAKDVGYLSEATIEPIYYN